jgi:hypothetical protein
MEIFKNLIKRFRKACQGLADVFSEAIKNTNMFLN